jgi:hypothetical protein
MVVLVVHGHNLSYAANIVMRTGIRSQSQKNKIKENKAKQKPEDPIQKLKQKSAGGWEMAQVVKCCLGKQDAQCCQK